MFDDGLETSTSEQQRSLETKVQEIYMGLAAAQGDAVAQEDLLTLLRASHMKYLNGGLGQLPSGFAVLDASRPWICYWILHSLALLNAPLPSAVTAEELVAFLASCAAPGGGYGGGPHQLAHLAPTYAAVAALVTLGTDDALACVDRGAMRAFLLRMALGPARGGGFTIHEGGRRGLCLPAACARCAALQRPAALPAPPALRGAQDAAVPRATRA
jgi:protein farnesyltransferase subunit beta